MRACVRDCVCVWGGVGGVGGSGGEEENRKYKFPGRERVKTSNNQGLYLLPRSSCFAGCF